MLNRVITALPTQPVRLGVRLGTSATPSVPSAGITAGAVGGAVIFYFADGDTQTVLLDTIQASWTEVVGSPGLYIISVAPATAQSLFRPGRAGPFQYVVLPFGV